MNNRMYTKENFDEAFKEYTLKFIPPKGVEHITLNFTMDKFPVWFLTPNESLEIIIANLRKEINEEKENGF